MNVIEYLKYYGTCCNSQIFHAETRITSNTITNTFISQKYAAKGKNKFLIKLSLDTTCPSCTIM